MLILNIFLLIGIGALVVSFFIEERSAIWGGATLGFIIGLIIGVIKGNFWDIILRAIFIGADVGLLANILAWIGARMKR